MESQDPGKTYRVKFAQSVALEAQLRKAYLEHLYHVFEAKVITPPKLKDSNKLWYFNTIMVDSKKHYESTVTAIFGLTPTNSTGKRKKYQIHRWLTPKALAYTKWFLDDGSMKSKESKAVILNTHSFELSDIKHLFGVEILKAWPRKQKHKDIATLPKVSRAVRRYGNKLYRSATRFESTLSNIYFRSFIWTAPEFDISL